MNDSVKIGDKYIVTSDGRVFTFHDNWHKWKEQKYRRHSNGYMRVTIYGKDEYVHRLVAKYFVPNPSGYTEVNHIDGNKENNCASNLEWCTRSRNNRHAFQTGLRSYDELRVIAKMPRPTRRKLSESQIREIRKSSLSDTELSKKYGIGRGAIYQIRKLRTYKEVV